MRSLLPLLRYAAGTLRIIPDYCPCSICSRLFIRVDRNDPRIISSRRVYKFRPPLTQQADPRFQVLHNKTAPHRKGTRNKITSNAYSLLLGAAEVLLLLLVWTASTREWAGHLHLENARRCRNNAVRIMLICSYLRVRGNRVEQFQYLATRDHVYVHLNVCFRLCDWGQTKHVDGPESG